MNFSATTDRTSRKGLLGRRSTFKKKQNYFIIAGLLPIIIYFAIFSIYPILSAFFISLHKWNLLDKTRPFLGLDNYMWAIHDPIFWISMKNTLYFAFFYVVVGTVLGLLLAVFVNNLRKPFIPLMRGVIFTPVVTSMVAVSLIFVWLYQPMFGVLNYILSFVGLGPYDWLNSPTQVIPSIIIMSVWKSVGYTMVIFIAGLTTIPREFKEAADVDGATPLWSFFHITLPLLRPTTLFVMVTGMIQAFQVFTQIYVMTQGGPGTASRTMVMHIYEVGFDFFEMGRASALTFFLFAVIMMATLLMLKNFKANFEY